MDPSSALRARGRLFGEVAADPDILEGPPLASSPLYPGSARVAYPSHAHPGPTWQVLLREMQVLPQALPTEQTLQQVRATGVG